MHSGFLSRIPPFSLTSLPRPSPPRHHYQQCSLSDTISSAVEINMHAHTRTQALRTPVLFRVLLNSIIFVLGALGPSSASDTSHPCAGGLAYVNVVYDCVQYCKSSRFTPHLSCSANRIESNHIIIVTADCAQEPMPIYANCVCLRSEFVGSGQRTCVGVFNLDVLVRGLSARVLFRSALDFRRPGLTRVVNLGASNSPPRPACHILYV